MVVPMACTRVVWRVGMRVLRKELPTANLMAALRVLRKAEN